MTMPDSVSGVAGKPRDVAHGRNLVPFQLPLFVLIPLKCLWHTSPSPFAFGRLMILLILFKINQSAKSGIFSLF